MEVDGFEPPRPRRAQDLQSRAIDRYAIPPNFFWWTEGESNSQLRLAKPLLSHLTTSPDFWRPRMDLNHWHLVLETNVLPDWTTEPFTHSLECVYRSTPRSQTPTFNGRTMLFTTDMLRYARIFLCTRTQAIPEAAHLQLFRVCCRIAFPGLHFAMLTALWESLSLFHGIVPCSSTF